MPTGTQPRPQLFSTITVIVTILERETNLTIIIFQIVFFSPFNNTYVKHCNFIDRTIHAKIKLEENRSRILRHSSQLISSSFIISIITHHNTHDLIIFPTVKPVGHYHYHHYYDYDHSHHLHHHHHFHPINLILVIISSSPVIMCLDLQHSSGS